MLIGQPAAAWPRRGPSHGRALRLALAGALTVAVLMASLGAVRSLAIFTSTDSTSGSLATDLLSPPSGLAATGGATVSLTWTATAKTWAVGHHVYRATDAGGPYSLVATITPRTTVSFVDAPLPGTYHYTVRAFFQGWESAADGPVSATVPPTSIGSGLVDCTASSSAADTTGAGDNNGYQTNAGSACVGDGAFAADPNSGTGGTASCGTGVVPDASKDRHRWWGYAFGLPGSVKSIDGIEVRALLRLNNNGGTTNVCTQLSWDGGTSWTSIASRSVSGGNDWTTYTFGSSADTWGRTWSLGELTGASFVVRVIDASTQTTKIFQLDALQVQVSYTP